MDNRDVVRQFLELAGATDFRHSPEGWVCRCPFHDGPTGHHRSKNPSFSINATSGFFMCFSGVCGRRGSLAYLLMDRCGFAFSRVKELLEDMFSNPLMDGGELPPPNQRRNVHWRAEQAYNSMETIPVEILGVFDRCPTYMLDRGFTKSVLKQWDVGYDVDSRRVTIPVWTKNRRLVGITKRAVDEWVEPRYKHLYFEKSMLLYGEHLVSDVTEAEPLIVVESQMSVFWLHQGGVRNVVSTLGSQISQNQIQRIARYPWVVIGMDEDEAGRNATNRMLAGRDRTEWDKTKGGKTLVHDPGLVEMMRRGRVRVVDSYCAEGCKDFQEIPLHMAVEVARGAVPWEMWNPDEST